LVDLLEIGLQIQNKPKYKSTQIQSNSRKFSHAQNSAGKREKAGCENCKVADVYLYYLLKNVNLVQLNLVQHFILIVFHNFLHILFKNSDLADTDNSITHRLTTHQLSQFTN